MLQGDFFYITELERDHSVVTAILRLDAGHPIFGGHFPGQPVVPGVCMMQMVKEVTEQALGKELQLVRADLLKFLAFVVPEENKTLRINLTIHSRENEETEVDAELLNEKGPCFKFRGLFSGSLP